MQIGLSSFERIEESTLIRISFFVKHLNICSFQKIYLSVAAGLICSNCFADTVWLNNGDRISGNIVELSNTSLKINTHYAATLSLAIDAIESFTTDTKRHWQINLASHSAEAHQSDQRGHVNIDGENIPILDLKLIPAQSKWKKTGLLETTLDVDNDKNRKEKLHINSELSFESKYWRHELKGEIKYDKENNKVTEDTEEFNYTLDYLFNEHWLWRTDSTYREEGTTVTQYYSYLGTGPGYRLWGEDEDRLDIIVSYNHLWLRSATLNVDLDAWGTKLDYTQFWFDKKLETFADIQISHLYLADVDYIVNTSAGLRFYFPHHIHLSLKYDYNETQYSFGSIQDSSYVLGAGANF